MFILAAPATQSQEIKRSRFVAVAAPIDDEETARTFLAEHSVASANHNCWAWRIGQSYRFSDDGEPSGTAGKPILQAIDGQELDHVVVLVTRWFGGTLLGSGGLMRAYGGTAALCLQSAEKQRFVQRRPLSFSVVFSDLALVKARLAGLGDVSVARETFTESGAVLEILIPATDADAILALIRDLTSGRAEVGARDG